MHEATLRAPGSVTAGQSRHVAAVSDGKVVNSGLRGGWAGGAGGGVPGAQVHSRSSWRQAAGSAAREHRPLQRTRAQMV
jgi:hypothetical protein